MGEPFSESLRPVVFTYCLSPSSGCRSDRASSWIQSSQRWKVICYCCLVLVSAEILLSVNFLHIPSFEHYSSSFLAVAVKCPGSSMGKKGFWLKITIL